MDDPLATRFGNDQQRQPLRKLTVVCPIYNEEASLDAFYNELVAQLGKAALHYQIIFVDDGSRDRSLQLLNALAEHDSCVSILSFARNFGHQAALTAGLDHAQGGDAVLVLDSDLQHPPAVLHQMIARYNEGIDIIYGVRRSSEDLTVFKRITSFGFYALLRLMIGGPVIRASADFRLMSMPAVHALASMREYHRYLRGMVQWLGFSVATVEYDQPRRYAGKPSYTPFKMLRLAIDAIFSFSILPLRFITGLGCGITIFGGLYLLYIFYRYFAVHDTIEGWPSILSAILILSGTQLISIGIVSQYVGMIFEETKKRPLYVLKQKRLAQPIEMPSVETEGV